MLRYRRDRDPAVGAAGSRCAACRPEFAHFERLTCRKLSSEFHDPHHTTPDTTKARSGNRAIVKAERLTSSMHKPTTYPADVNHNSPRFLSNPFGGRL